LKHPVKSRQSPDDYAKGILQRDRVVLAQAITLVESTLPEDQQLAAELIQKIHHVTGNSIRIGITGVPGVGKSTMIEALGNLLVNKGKRVAVLTIDPSSPLTQGSILGDKTRMELLSKNPNVFVRSTAAGGSLGGVAARTREAMLLCEAAGYDIVIVETVGVGQSETTVRGMVDFFLLLMLPGAGDELQGIKKGIVEMADAIAITKADGTDGEPAQKAKMEYERALALMASTASGWRPRVLTTSAVTEGGVYNVWTVVKEYAAMTSSSGYFSENRKQQNVLWCRDHFNMLLQHDYERFTELKSEIKNIEALVTDRKLSPPTAAQEILSLYHRAIRSTL